MKSLSARTYPWAALTVAAVELLLIVTFSALVGAFETPAMLARLQNLMPTLTVYPTDWRWALAFKYRVMNHRHPELIWLGASRGGTATEAMFRPYKFYNLSFVAWTPYQLADAFEVATRDEPPKTVIICLDYVMFSTPWVKQYQAERTQITDQPLHYLRLSFGDFLQLWATSPLLMMSRAIEHPFRYFGSQGLSRLEGFRDDGSYAYSEAHAALARETQQTARQMLDAYPGSAKMDPIAIQHIERLADLARRRGISVIAVQLPYIREGVAYLDSTSPDFEHTGNWHHFESQQTRDWLASLGIAFFDLAHFQLDDQSHDFIDASHPSETGMRKIIARLMQEPEFRARLPAGIEE